jgi:hypothetical protein
MWEHVNQCVAEENEECKEDLEEIELLADSYYSGSKPPKITTISCSCGGNPFGSQLSSWVLLLERNVKKLTPNIITLPDAQGQGIQIQVPRVAVLEALREAMEDQYKYKNLAVTKVFEAISKEHPKSTYHRDCQVYVGKQVMR